MPASELQWSPNSQFNAFTVQGRTKRKAESGQHACPQVEYECAAKRACHRAGGVSVETSVQHSVQPTHSVQQIDEEMSDHAPEINHNYMTSQNVQAEPQAQVTEEMCGMMDMSGETYSPYIVPYPTPHSQQLGQTHQIAQQIDQTQQMDQTHAQEMDHTQQSNDTSQQEHTQDETQETKHQHSADYCNQFCGVEGGRNTVRCYCNPSWEGMMGTRPYISDVY